MAAFNPFAGLLALKPTSAASAGSASQPTATPSTTGISPTPTTPAVASGTSQSASGATSALQSIAKQMQSAAPASGVRQLTGSRLAAPAGTVDTSGYFNNALASVDKQDAAARQAGQDNIAALQRRAATLSALSGRGVGQGYLNGLNQATITGQNAMQQELAKNEALRQQIYGSQENQAFANNQRLGSQQFADDQRNKTQQFANNQRVDQNNFNVQTQTALAKSEADAKQLDTQRSTSINIALGALQGMGITPSINGQAGHGATNARATALINAVQNATTPEAVQAAQAALNNYLAKLAQLKSQNPGKKGEDWNAILKQAENSGYFGG